MESIISETVDLLNLHVIDYVVLIRGSCFTRLPAETLAYFKSEHIALISSSSNSHYYISLFHNSPIASPTNTPKPASYTLELTLPSSYPSTSSPTAYLNCGDTVSTSRRKEARAALSQIVDSQPTDLEVLDQITSSLIDLLPTLTAPDQSSRPSSIKDGVEGNNNNKPAQKSKTSSEPQKIKQVIIWSHHLLATSKRRAIQSWSKELHLAGFARPGHPGAIVAEGQVDQVDEFVKRLKALRWQALQVRAEDVVEARMLGSGDEGVVECESLGEIAESLKSKDAEVGAMFLEGMKISH